MAEFNVYVVVVAHGIRTPVYKGIHGEEKAIEKARKWFKDNVEGEENMEDDCEVVVTEKVEQLVKVFSVSDDRSRECPNCGKQMEFEGYRRYETLSEHVSDPNQLNPEKPYWTCECSPGFFGINDGYYNYDEDGNLLDEDGNIKVHVDDVTDG